MGGLAGKALVLVGYDREKMIRSLRFCNRYFRAIPENQRVLVLNHSALLVDDGILDLSEGWKVLQGSNSRHEFSAWQEGLDHLRQQVEGIQGVIFINDTVPAHRYFSLFKRIAFYFSLKSQKAIAVGFIQALADWQSFRLGKLEANCWICSYLFYLSEEALQAISYQVCIVEEVEQCLNLGLDERTFFSSELSPNISQKLQTWLFSGGWYASEKLSSENVDRFTMKARSILNEMILTARYQNNGIQLIEPFKRYPVLCILDGIWTRLFEAPYKLLKRIGLA